MTPIEKAKKLWLKHNKNIDLMPDKDKDKGFKVMLEPYVQIALKEQAKQKEQELIRNLTHGWYDECPFSKESVIGIITDIMRSENES